MSLLNLALDITEEVVGAPFDDFTRLGIKAGFKLARVVLGAALKPASDRITRWAWEKQIATAEKELNACVQSGDFDGAKRIVVSLPIHDEAKLAIFGQIVTIEAEYARIREPFDKLERLVNAGKESEAKSFVDSLDMPASDRSELIDKITEFCRRRREREALARNGKRWNAELNRLLEQGNAEGAVRYVQSLPLSSEHADSLVEKIRAADEARRKQEEVNRNRMAWNADVTLLLQLGQFDQAVRYVQALEGLPREEKAAVLKQIRAEAKERSAAERNTRDLYDSLARGKFGRVRKLLHKMPIDPRAKQTLLDRLPPEVTWQERFDDASRVAGLLMNNVLPTLVGVTLGGCILYLAARVYFVAR